MTAETIPNIAHYDPAWRISPILTQLGNAEIIPLTVVTATAFLSPMLNIDKSVRLRSTDCLVIWYSAQIQKTFVLAIPSRSLTARNVEFISVYQRHPNLGVYLAGNQTSADTGATNLVCFLSVLPGCINPIDLLPVYPKTAEFFPSRPQLHDAGGS